jgi:hypothetical protein
MWWYRRRVPRELQALIGRAEYRESLNTPDIEVARTRAAFRDAEVAVEFEGARSRLRQQQAPAPEVPAQLTREAERFIADAVHSHILKEDEEVRMSRPDPDALEAYESIRADQFDDASRALATGRVALGMEGRQRIRGLIQAIGLSVAPDPLRGRWRHSRPRKAGTKDCVTSATGWLASTWRPRPSPSPRRSYGPHQTQTTPHALLKCSRWAASLMAT